MKKLIVLIVLLLGSYAYSQNSCELFKVGKFQNIEDGVLKATIVRNDSIQVEKYGDKIVKLRIEWLDECSYKLKFLEGNQAFWDSRPENMPTDDLIVRITEVDGNSYTQESKFVNDEDFVYKSNIERIDY